ncbi:phosphotransferase enzyme family protein [Beauveria brongniartii RCEF 3172]|uniref:Phosphotransferase enzyme family protein n=1 Tax=Beauveria brongniartii RCEF 3172 TaxID=1081107 RepID=A0A162KEC8_9HYPO|nr:phosphotransferase enzyme family protein [Beauveria brongniartii RCEF 3172]
MKHVLQAKPEQRLKLFSDLISIYSQIFQLRFSVAGSLMPSSENHDGPHVDGLLSMAENELVVSTCRSIPGPRILHSAESYVQYQLDMVSKSARLPLIDGTLNDVRDQVFALDHLELEARRSLGDLRPHEGASFILTHPDLHYANIIVDENLRIQGIIDWEFAGTVPQHLFTPPAWTTGHDGRGCLRPPREIVSGFQTALRLSKHEELKSHWKRIGQPVTLATAQIFCHPTKLERLFFDFVFPGMYTGSRDEIVSFFFSGDKNAALAAQAEKQLGESDRYKSYLQEHGLYDDIEEEKARLTDMTAKILDVLFPSK